MIELQINPKDNLQLTLKERLEDQVVAMKIVENEALLDPVLIEGENRYQGINPINRYLDDLERFLKQWYDCRCDKYED